MPEADNQQFSSQRERLSAEKVGRMHRAVGGDLLVEEMILRFIAHRYGARSLVFLPTHVAA
jgi:hypothetical protein